MNLETWITLAFFGFMYVSLWAIGRWILPHWKFAESSLEAREAKLQIQVSELEKRLKESETKNKDLERTQDFLLRELQKANSKIVQQETELRALSSKVRELENIATTATPKNSVKIGRILGVWPTSLPLDTEGEKKALKEAGLEYDALEGEAASRLGIVEQLGQRDDYTIVEIGAKGSHNGIQLSDGIAPPSWWLHLAKQHRIEIFVVLANESGKPGTINVADALYTAGAKAVISVESSITDEDAVRFAHMFYRRLSRGVPLAKAVEYAKLVLTDTGADVINLRER